MGAGTYKLTNQRPLWDRWVGRRPVQASHGPFTLRPRSSPQRCSATVNGSWWLCRSLCGAVVCTGRTQDSGRPRKPRNGEYGGRVRRWRPGVVGTAGTCRADRPPSGQGRVCPPPCPAPPQVPVSYLAGSGPRPRASCPVPSCQTRPSLEAALAALRAQPSFFPDGAVTERVKRGPSFSPTPEFARGRSCGVWHPEFLLSPTDTCIFLSFRKVKGAGYQIHDPVPPPKLYLGLAINP